MGMVLNDLFRFGKSKIARQKSPKQLVSDSWADRVSVLEREVNLYCWERTLDASIADYLEKKIVESPETVLLDVHLADCKQIISHAQELWGKTNTVGERLFWQDVASLTMDFLHYADHGAARLQLKVVEGDACTKFHIDGYRLRLFTTYLGPGTEWLPEQAVNRTALGTTNESIVRDPSAIRQMKAGDVGILKGEPLTGQGSKYGIVHKSPAISAAGEKRVTLRIDI